LEVHFIDKSVPMAREQYLIENHHQSNSFYPFDI